MYKQSNEKLADNDHNGISTNPFKQFMVNKDW